MIRPDVGFVLYARAEVNYIGRAKSKIGPANLVIVHKIDGALLIHGAIGCLPINYQRSKSKLSVHENKMICNSKHESIEIYIYDVYHYYEINEWSSDKLRMTGTEKQYCGYICDDLPNILETSIERIDREVPALHGSIDILATGSDGTKHVIEVKRKRATKSAVFQLKKYCDDISTRARCIGYIAAPDIGDKALIFLESLGYKYLRVENKLVF